MTKEIVATAITGDVCIVVANCAVYHLGRSGTIPSYNIIYHGRLLKEIVISNNEWDYAW